MQGSPEQIRRDPKKNSTIYSATTGAMTGPQKKNLNSSNIVSRQKVQSFGSADKR